MPVIPYFLPHQTKNGWFLSITHNEKHTKTITIYVVRLIVSIDKNSTQVFKGHLSLIFILRDPKEYMLYPFSTHPFR